MGKKKKDSISHRTEESLSSNSNLDICPRCFGLGKLVIPMNYREQPENTYSYYKLCPKCKGYGYIDWISNIMGQK